jgi:hypothetical protein
MIFHLQKNRKIRSKEKQRGNEHIMQENKIIKVLNFKSLK